MRRVTNVLPRTSFGLNSTQLRADQLGDDRELRARVVPRQRHRRLGLSEAGSVIVVCAVWPERVKTVVAPDGFRRPAAAPPDGHRQGGDGLALEDLTGAGRVRAVVGAGAAREDVEALPATGARRRPRRR